MTNDTIELLDRYPLTRFYTNGLLAGTFISASIAANIVVIASWMCDRGRWLPLYYYFLAFASWNLTLLMSTFFFYSLPAILRQPADQSTIASAPYFYVVGYAGANCSLTAVVWLMVVLTVERYVAVTRPFHTRISSPRRRAKLISITLSITAVLYNIPLTFELSIIGAAADQSIDNDQTSSKQAATADACYFWTVETAPFRSNFYYQTLYRILGHLLFISLVPFVIISTLTMKIVFVVQRTNRDRVLYRRAMMPPTMTTTAIGHHSPSLSVRTTPVAPENNRTSSRTSSAAAATYDNVLLTVFVVKFLLCYTLPFALNVLELLVPARVFQTAEFMWITDLSDFLVILDSVSNAFLYFSWRRRTRFSKNKRAVPSGLKETAGGASEYLSVPCSPNLNFSRTLSTKCDHHVRSQSMKSFPISASVPRYRELIYGQAGPKRVTLRVPDHIALKAARV